MVLNCIYIESLPVLPFVLFLVSHCLHCVHCDDRITYVMCSAVDVDRRVTYICRSKPIFRYERKNGYKYVYQYSQRKIMCSKLRIM